MLLSMNFQSIGSPHAQSMRGQTTKKAVQIQIWIALLAMLLLKFLQLQSTRPWSLSNLAALLRFNLLTDRDLWIWLNAPFGCPAITPIPMQATLFAT
jgi:hypothetical protein